MNDDAGILDEMISSSNSIESIANAVEQDVLDSEMYSVNSFNFYEQDSRIKEFIFIISKKKNSIKKWICLSHLRGK